MMNQFAAEIVKLFQKEFPELTKAMNDCSHHYSHENLSPYHLEGPVWAHTMMVLLSAAHISKDKSVILAALGHDIGKPQSATVDDSTRKIRMFGHEGISCYLFLDFLYRRLKEGFISEMDLITCFQLIAHHQDTRTREGHLEDMFQGRPVFWEKLKEMVLADGMGRFVDEFKDKNLDSIIIPRKVNNYEESELVVLIGPPLSGKSTFSSNFDDFYIISRDAVIQKLYGEERTPDENWKAHDPKRVNETYQKELQYAYKNKLNVLIDNTSMSIKSRRSSVNLFKKYKKSAYVFLISLPVLFERNEIRSKQGKTIGSGTIDKMIKNFAMPSYEEFDEIYIVLEGGKIINVIDLEKQHQMELKN